MRTFELRQYTLRGKEALEIYMNQVYPRHLDSFPLFGIEPHGVWTVKDSAESHGQSLTPVLAALKDWGDTHLDLFNNKTEEKIIDTRTAAKSRSTTC